MKHLKLKSFFLALLLTCGVGQMWAGDPYIGQFGVQFRDDNGTTWKVSTSGDNCINGFDFGSKTNFKIVRIYANGYCNYGNLCTDYMWWQYEITRGGEQVQDWFSMSRDAVGDWNNCNPVSYYWGEENSETARIDLVSNLLPGGYQMNFLLKFTGNSGSGCGVDYYCKYSGNNWYFNWTIPDPTISFTANHTPVKGQPVTLTTEVSNWPTGMTVKSVTYKHNGTTISTPSSSLTSTSYTHTPTVAGDDIYSVEVVCTFGTAGDVTYTEYLDVTDSYTVTYGSHANGSFTIAVPNIAAASSNEPAASGQTVTLAATGNTGYELSSWTIKKTSDASDVTSSVSLSSSSTTPATFTMPGYGVTVDAAFVGKHYDVTLNPDNNNSTSTIYPQYTAAMPSTLKGGSALSAPTYSGYAFQGYYDDHAGSGTQYYTSAMSSANNWDKTSTATLYAKWTQTVELDANGGSSDGSVSVTYKGMAGTPSAPSYSGYTLDGGYYAESSCTNKVMNLDGSLEPDVTINLVPWTSSGKWVHASSSELFAHWKCNAPSISCTDNVVTITAPAGASVRYTTDGTTTPTSSTGSVYDPSNKPTIAANTTIKAVAYRTGYTMSDVTTQAVTYTPVYSVGFTTTNTSKATGETSVLENKTYTAIFNANTGYNLPSDVTVTINGNTATKTTDYTWSEGTLTILANKIDGNVTITVNGVAKTYTATDNINNNGGDTDGQYTATYGASNIVINTEPTKAGYEVEGYYRYAEGNNKVADADGSLVTGLDGVITSGLWIYDNDDLVLYPQWVPKSYTITLDAQLNGISGTTGSSNFTAKSGTSDYSDRTMPTKEGYTFAGYYTTAGGGVQILNANGGVVGSMTDYTDGNGKWTNTDDNLTLYAHWTDNGTYVFKGGAIGNVTSWSTAANWTKGVAPSAATDSIVILAPVVVPENATTSVKSVRIATSGTYTDAGGNEFAANGKLTIPATAMLKVTNDVQNCVINGSSQVASEAATTTATLHIQSASSGNGALVWGKAKSTPGKAQVDFYTKSSSAGNKTGSISDVNQYIGTPFSDESNYYNYYNAWVFKVNDAGTAWERLPMGTGMSPFIGYDVIYDGAAGHVFEMDGTLVTNENRSLTASNATESVLANSWVAPIKIKAFEAGDFSGPNATIYIFNSTSESASAGDKDGVAIVGGGNYSAYAPGSAEETEVIPSMQSFSVTGGTGTVALDYSKLVKTPASNTLIGAMHAPRRVAADDAEPEEELELKMERLKVYVSDENGWGDLLKICIREDFVEEFENGFDARKMYGDPAAPTLYGISPDGRMAINCIPTADNHVLGFHAGSASNEYTFRFAYDGEDELYLLDNKTGIETPITAEDTYTFTSESGDNDLRFSIIRKTPAVPTDIETVTGESLQTTGVQKIMYNGMLYILRSGRIYDATGALVK